MILFHSLTAENRVLAIHQSLGEAIDFARNWRDLSGAGRVAKRVVSAERGQKGVIYARTDRFNTKYMIAEFPI